MVREHDFDRDVGLPPALTVAAVRRAIEYVERELADFVEVYAEQAIEPCVSKVGPQAARIGVQGCLSAKTAPHIGNTGVNNVFSALVGIFATRALDANSVYERSRHADTAQQRFPDLKRRGSGETRRRPRIVWSARPASVRGLFSRTMTTPGGT